MKKGFYFIIASILFLGCETQSSHQRIETDGYTIITIDSCEYIEVNEGILDQRVYSLTHKGNCKFCKKNR